jgi:alkylation response protein AidB-like acyl-CoA dehydrogenase
MVPQARAKALAAKAKARMGKVEGKAAKVAKAWAKARAKVRTRATLQVLGSNYLCKRPLALHLRRPAIIIPIWPMSHVTSVTRKGTTSLSALNGLL